MTELPRPFDNDDDEAAAGAVGRLNQIMAEAQTRAQQDDAIARTRQLLDRERAKRSERDTGPSCDPEPQE
jgi:hypothetical protein